MSYNYGRQCRNIPVQKCVPVSEKKCVKVPVEQCEKVVLDKCKELPKKVGETVLKKRCVWPKSRKQDDDSC